jgi:AcrR family transcriptional regulator
MREMHGCAATRPVGLRERKRERTRRTIARAALDLFDRQGFHATTIPQIAEAADVSPRTVSAYFPHKEELAFPDAEAELRSLDARLRDRQPEETAISALREWIRSKLEEDDRAAERRTRRRVIGADDGLRAYENRYTLAVQELVAGAIAQDLDASPDDLEPRMAAAATLTVFELLAEDYDNRNPVETLDSREFQREALATVGRALLFIDGGIRALHGAARTAVTEDRAPER